MINCNKLLLIVNLGSPKKPEPKEVGEFLNEFLMDPLVIDIPFPLRWLLVKKLIVPRRSIKSAEAYAKVWSKDTGSPLVHLTKELCHHLKNHSSNFKIDYAMRYNGPSIEEVIKKNSDCQEVYLLPLYPQYAESSTETVFSEVKRIRKNNPNMAKIFKLNYFYNKPEYIDAISALINKQLEGKNIDHLLFSYHGLPERHLKKLGADYKNHCLKEKNCCEKRFGTEHFCYRSHSKETTHLISKKLKIDFTYSTSFQSRLGRAEWIKPYTTEHIVDLVENKKVKNIAVVCPSFVSDCLETLEEVDMELREQFMELGGENFYYLPALNIDENWLESLSTLIERTHSNWKEVK